jgi:hypothetical protein
MGDARFDLPQLLELGMKRFNAIILLGVLVSCGPVMGADSQKPIATTKASAKAGRNCLFIGHSFFIPVARRFEKLPGQSGVTNHRQKMVFAGGRNGSPGSLWKGGKRPAIQKILASGKIELLGMTYYDSTNSSFEDYQRWIDYALKYNSKTRFFIGLCWGKNGAKRTLAEYAGSNLKASKALYQTVVALRKKYPNNTIIYINYGTASVELKRQFEAGNLPDVKSMVSRSGVYRDSMGHAAGILQDLSTLVWLKAIYGVDPTTSGVKLTYKTDLKPIAKKIVSEQTNRRRQAEKAK